MHYIDRAGFDSLLDHLRTAGYDLVGPVERDGAIVFDRIDSSAELPRGVEERQEAGTYRLIETGSQRLFAFAHGPDSAKRFLFPPRETLSVAAREGGRLTIAAADDDEPPLAFIGLRSCDLHAVEVQDRVFIGGVATDHRYARRREQAFFVGVDCAKPGGTCFCASMGTGPHCTAGYDLALTELEDGFLVAVGTARGQEALEAIDARAATHEEELEAEVIRRDAFESMGRSLDTSDMPDLLYRNREHPQWSDVSARCLACGNCTSACPTCFCHDAVETPSITGVEAERTREWASCFSEEFSHTAGGPVRSSREARYRQWLTHKFASWIDQFGTSGCVGCGRCITWCPVGIDVTAEIQAIRAADGERSPEPVGVTR